MKMKKIAIILSLIVVCSFTVSAKRGLHTFGSKSKDFVELGVGPNYMFADFGGSNFPNLWVTDWDLKYTRPTVSLSYQHNYNDYIGNRLTFQYSLFSGNDESSRNEVRKFEYYSNAFELSAQLVVYLYRGQTKRTSFDLYAFAGVGYLWYLTAWKAVDYITGEPIPGRELTYKSDRTLAGPGSWDESKGLFTGNSGCGVVPFGLGVSFPILPRLNLGVEVGWRYLFGKDADLIDGISTYWSKMNDTYATLTFTIKYRISGSDNDCYAKYGQGQMRHLNKRIGKRY